MEFSVALKLGQLVGRESVKKAIGDALSSGKKAFIIVGEGGIGKTQILEHLDEFIQERYKEDPELKKKVGKRKIIDVDIIDFYNVEIHSIKGLVSTILDLVAEKFKGMDDSLYRMISGMSDRVENGDISEYELPTKLEELFNKLAQSYYLVFKFDTMELLEYGEDAPEVIKACEIESGEPVPPLKCLKEHFPKFNYGFAIFAGRPTVRTIVDPKTGRTEERPNFIYEQLGEGFDDSIVKFNDKPYMELKGFSEEETKEYIKAVLRELPNLPDYEREEQNYKGLANEIENEILNSDEGFKKLYLLTGGRPIYIALTLDWFTRGFALAELAEKSVDEIQDDLERIKKKFEKSLVERVKDLGTPLSTIVRYASRFKKGFTLDMMIRLMNHEKEEYTEDEIKDALEEFKKLSFVKSPYVTPDKERRLFLHDEMYDLIDKYVWGGDYHDLSKQKEIARFISNEIYGNRQSGLIGEVYKKIERTNLFRDWLSLRRKAEALWTEKLFYELDADPMNGYYLYDKLDTVALSQRRGEWNDLLRSEIIRFMRKNSHRQDVKDALLDDKGRIKHEINLDCMIRWLRRFQLKGIKTREDIEHIADKIFENYGKEASYLWQIRFHALKGALLRRMGIYNADLRGKRNTDATTELEGALKIISKTQEIKDFVLGTRKSHNQKEVLKQLVSDLREMLSHITEPEEVLNLIHELKRYLDLISKLKNPSISESYRDYLQWMLSHYEALSTLHLGLINRALGENKKATQRYEKAREIFKKNNEPFSEARALNNQAYVEARMGKFQEANAHIYEALDIRKRIGDLDGYALSLVVQGFIEDRMGFYPAALKHAREAKHVVRSVYETKILPPYMYGILVEARAMRHLAQKYEEAGTKLSFEYLDDAEKALKELKNYENSLEPYYRWELYNELAQVFTRRARIMAHRDMLKSEDEVNKFIGYLDEADKFFKKAHEIAQEAQLTNQIMDNADDWSWVWIIKLESYQRIKDKIKESEEKLYEGALNKIDEGRKQLENNEVIPIRVRMNEEFDLPKYYEGFYWLGSLYYTRARLIEDHYGKIWKNDALQHVIQNLLRANVLYNLFTDQPIERASNAEILLLSKLESMDPVKARKSIEAAINDLKEHIAIAIKIKDKRLSKIEIRSLGEAGFMFDKERNFLMLKLSQPAENWDQVKFIDKNFLNRVKKTHEELPGQLPVFRSISTLYPKINFKELLSGNSEEVKNG